MSIVQVFSQAGSPSGVQTGGSRSPRYSRCAAHSRAQELERLRGMSVEARISAALTMNDRFAWLKPTTKGWGNRE